MNKSQIARSIGKIFFLRPQAIRSTDDGSGEPIDDQWALKATKPNCLVLRNLRTDHECEIGFDNLREFRSPHFLLLKCQLYIKGNQVKLEPQIVPGQTSNVVLSLEFAKTGGTIEGRIQYQLKVKVGNNGNSAIGNYHVDLEFPSMFIDPRPHYALEVNDRRTETLRVFRATQEDHLNKPIYPGDKKIVMSVDYFFELRMFASNEDCIKQIVKARLYCDGGLGAEAEKQISELLGLNLISSFD